MRREFAGGRDQHGRRRRRHLHRQRHSDADRHQRHPQYPLQLRRGEPAGHRPPRQHPGQLRPRGQRPRLCGLSPGPGPGTRPGAQTARPGRCPLGPGRAPALPDRLVAVLGDIASHGLRSVEDCTPWEELREPRLDRLATQRPAVRRGPSTATGGRCDGWVWSMRSCCIPVRPCRRRFYSPCSALISARSTASAACSGVTSMTASSY
ncbi:hypothetical protein FNJ62_12535 [Streptomyces benahoarensis]|uniref:Uncharacterized protein n=1 Tax=Streptomyces benahoarensis TaxID=2595054 RepID=A0A553ZPM4_9ACTN|nr:hypothetical protein FNJ62_12535 [Streptomyces benahoarensis]TSB43402.1 hypothetical protein FNZ23_04755 [Streptomyces benahoarensis]